MPAQPPKPDFQQLFEKSPGLYLVLLPDLDFTIVSVTDTYLRATMTTREAILGHGLFEVFPDNPDDPHATGTRNLRASLERVIATKAANTMAVQKYDIRRPETAGGGFEERYWSPVNTPVLSPENEVSYIIHRVEDVTEFVRINQRGEKERDVLLARERVAQAETEAERQKLRDIFQQAPVAICILEGPHHTFSFANTTYLALVSQRDVMGKPLLEALPELEGQGFVEMLDQVVATGEPFVGQEVPLKLAHHAEDEYDYMNFVYQPKRDSHGRVDGVLVCAFKVTEQVLARRRVDALRAQAEETVRLRDEFLSVASHELKTPLTPLSLKLQALARASEAGESPEKTRRLANDIAVMRRQVKRLSDLVNDLLDVSRLSTGRMRFELEQVDLSALVHDVVARFEYEAERVGGGLEISPGPPVVGNWDRLRLEQVVTNLLSNAIKYGAGKPIRVRVESEAGRARLVVQDHGIGIASDALERIFNKFERAVSERNYGGLGLGLYVTRQIVEGLGGTVQVESTPGQGATFTVELPLGGAESGASSHAPGEPGAPDIPKIGLTG